MIYERKPMIVDAFIFGVDDNPEWFMNRVTDGRINLRIDPICTTDSKAYVKTKFGYDFILYGNYAAKDESGNVKIYKAYDFEKAFILVSR